MPTQTVKVDTIQEVKPFDKQVIKEHGLTEDEYKRIKTILGRHPTTTELGMFSVLWSEHCSYKHSKPLLKMFPTTGKYVLQGPGENAGIVDIGGGLAVSFKIESHNHPSAVEPFQGAATGVGGIVRDIISMGARPVAVMDPLRFGAADHPDTARQHAKMVGNLRAKQLDLHQKAQWREDQKLMDDLASRRGRPTLAWKPEESAS